MMDRLESVDTTDVMDFVSPTKIKLIGTGGAGGGMVAYANFISGKPGGNTILTNPNAPDTVTAPGGGGGAGTANPGIPAGVAGGSGGGAASGGSAGGTG